MGIKKYLTQDRILLYILIFSIIVFLTIKSTILFITNSSIESLISFLGYLPFEFALLTFAFLTQETSSKYPMSKMRAFAYAISAFFMIFVISITAIVYTGLEFLEYLVTAPETDMFTREIINSSLSEVDMSNKVITILMFLVMLLLFGLPSICSFIYLKLTGKDRRKPWAIQSKAKTN